MSHQDLDSKATFSFPTEGREEYAGRMAEYGYVEFDGYAVSPRNYCCGNCPSMRDEPNSPTGYWCDKFGFPDRPNGCSDGWSPREAPK